MLLLLQNQKYMSLCRWETLTVIAIVGSSCYTDDQSFLDCGLLWSKLQCHLKQDYDFLQRMYIKIHFFHQTARCVSAFLHWLPVPLRFYHQLTWVTFSICRVVPVHRPQCGSFLWDPIVPFVLWAATTSLNRLQHWRSHTHANDSMNPGNGVNGGERTNWTAICGCWAQSSGTRYLKFTERRFGSPAR